MKIGVTHDATFGPHKRQRLDVYDPGKPSAPVVIFIHGGSWQRGSKMMYRFVGRALASMGYVAVLPSYRMYPEVKFPAFVEDGALAVRWTCENFPGRKVFIAGHSAGALNASLVAYDPRYLKQAGVPTAALTGFIGLAGPYNFYPRPDLRPVFDLPSQDRSWLPIANIHAKLPALLVHGHLDAIVAVTNSQSYAEELRKHGATVTLRLYRLMEHMAPIIWLLPGLRWFSPVACDIKRFLRQNS